jgi:hypothetical protein
MQFYISKQFLTSIVDFKVLVAKYCAMVFLCLLIPVNAVSAEFHCVEHGRIKFTGIYSDMRYGKESGDVIGQEIFIVFSKDGYFAILQSSEGEPSKPVVVPVSIGGMNIKFLVPTYMDSRGEFNGTICNNHLVGTFQGNGQKINLGKKNSYWQ